jgi:hypothetical protein
MIAIDPFYLLLLLELLILQSGFLVFLYFRKKKGRATVKEIIAVPEPVSVAPPEVKAEGPSQDFLEEEAPKTTAPEAQADHGDFTFLTEEADEGKSSATAPPKGDVDPEVERLSKTLDEKVEVILELKGKIEEMEKKFEGMENEYQVLFDTSQKQEQALKAYEKGKTKAGS